VKERRAYGVARHSPLPDGKGCLIVLLSSFDPSVRH
jgi:hypothetical protein